MESYILSRSEISLHSHCYGTGYANIGSLLPTNFAKHTEKPLPSYEIYLKTLWGTKTPVFLERRKPCHNCQKPC